jgi:hypothetical protein
MRRLAVTPLRGRDRMFWAASSASATQSKFCAVTLKLQANVPMADLNAKVRAILERPIAELVEMGLQGGRPSAIHMIAFQMLIRLDARSDFDALLHLRTEIDDALEAAKAEAGGLN